MKNETLLYIEFFLIGALAALVFIYAMAKVAA